MRILILCIPSIYTTYRDSPEQDCVWNVIPAGDRAMTKLGPIILTAVGLLATGCDRSDVEHARSQAREVEQKAKEDLKEADRKLKDGWERANEQTKQDLYKAREQAREALRKSEKDLEKGRRK